MCSMAAAAVRCMAEGKVLMLAEGLSLGWVGWVVGASCWMETVVVLQMR